MKYYIYISDTKVDMLYPQIPKSILKKIASTLSIDLKLLGAEISVAGKGNSSDDTRYSKVQIVSEYIEKHLDVGSIDAPSTYLKGKLSMGWGPTLGIAYFGGNTARTILGLGGSGHHIIGSNQESLKTDSYSSLNFLREFFEGRLHEGHHFSSVEEEMTYAIADLNKV